MIVFALSWDGTLLLAHVRNGERVYKLKIGIVGLSWRHICVTYDYNSETIAGYLDGNLSPLDSVTNTNTSAPATGSLYVGGPDVATNMLGWLVCTTFYQSLPRTGQYCSV